jgi:hypothetical protein
MQLLLMPLHLRAEIKEGQYYMIGEFFSYIALEPAQVAEQLV